MRRSERRGRFVLPPLPALPPTAGSMMRELSMLASLRRALLPLALATALFATAHCAWAQGASAPAAAASAASAPSSAAKKELVAKVIALQQPGIDAIARNLAEQPVTTMMRDAAPVMARVPADKRDAVSKTVEAEVRKYLDETVPMLRDRAARLAPATLGPVLEEKFSEDELRQLVAWLDSPLNRKFQATAPEMQSALVQKLVADMRATVEPKLQTLEQRIAAALGLQPGAGASAPAGAPAPAASGAARPAPSKPASAPARSQP